MQVFADNPSYRAGRALRRRRGAGQYDDCSEFESELSESIGSEMIVQLGH